jgi:hypothetical protein
MPGGSGEPLADSPARRPSQVGKGQEEVAHLILEQSLLDKRPEALEAQESAWDVPVIDPTQVSADYDKSAEQARVGDELNWERTPEGACLSCIRTRVNRNRRGRIYAQETSTASSSGLIVLTSSDLRSPETRRVHIYC